MTRLHIDHLNKGLLFQFVLAETLAAAEQFSILSRTISFKNKRRLQDLESALQALLGSSQEHWHWTPWIPYDGILTKLKRYCIAFSQPLQQLANRLCILCHTCIELINNRCYDELSKQITKLLLHHQRWIKQIIQNVKAFAQDENVLFYFLRHHEHFDTYFGEGFVRKIFLRLFPNLSVAEEYICQKYAQRGFTHLLPIISAKISEIP